MKNRRYTDEEIAIIRERYPKEPTKRLAARLGRNIPALQKKAADLGLKKDIHQSRKKPLGSVSYRNNTMLIKTKDTGFYSDDWERLDHLIWMAHNGPIPQSHVLIFKDGDRRNIALQNLACIPKREIAIQNFAQGQPELVPILAMCAELKRTIKDKTGSKRRKS